MFLMHLSAQIGRVREQRRGLRFHPRKVVGGIHRVRPNETSRAEDVCRLRGRWAKFIARIEPGQLVVAAPKRNAARGWPPKTRMKHLIWDAQPLAETLRLSHDS